MLTPFLPAKKNPDSPRTVVPAVKKVPNILVQYAFVDEAVAVKFRAQERLFHNTTEGASQPGFQWNIEAKLFLIDVFFGYEPPKCCFKNLLLT